jgi:hypothetical protein
MPAPVIARLSAAMKKVLGDPKVAEKFVGLGTEARFNDSSGLLRDQAHPGRDLDPGDPPANLKLE